MSGKKVIMTNWRRGQRTSTEMDKGQNESKKFGHIGVTLEGLGGSYCEFQPCMGSVNDITDPFIVHFWLCKSTKLEIPILQDYLEDKNTDGECLEIVAVIG